MELAVFLISLFTLLFTGLPIGIVLMACCMILMYFIDMSDLSYQLSFQNVGGIDNYILFNGSILYFSRRNHERRRNFPSAY